MTYEFSGRLPQPKRILNALKSPKRISITLPYKTHEDLISRSNEDGRSLSNLAAYLLESALGNQEDIKRRIP